MADRIELSIQIQNLDQAKVGLAQIKAQMAELDHKKAVLKVDLEGAKAWKHEIEDALKLAKEEGNKVSIAKLQEELAQAKLRVQELTAQQSALNAESAQLKDTYKDAKNEVQSQQSAVTQLRSEIVAAENAERSKASATEQSTDAEKSNAEAARETKEATEGAATAARNEADALDESKKNADELASAAERAEARFQAVLGVVNGIADALGAAASVVEGINSFGQGIFNVIGGAGEMFSFSVIDKALDTATSLITQNALGNFDKITSRYDIMSTFTQYMSLMGVSEEAADRALARVNESILGLPIGLDEAAYRLRRYQMFIGDIDRTTDFTIGLQKAIMAGGANEQMRHMAYTQIERLLTTGNLSTARQWMSLLNGMGVSVQYIAEELGHADMGGKELAGALYSGKITADEFLGAIESLGKGTSNAAHRMVSALGVYKGTLESWMSNIEFAFIRGGANTLTSLNTMLTVETGVSITGYMEAFRNKINEAYTEIQEWIYTHPESFAVTFDALDSLGESLSNFNLGKIAEGALNHSAKFIEAIASAVGKLDPDRTEGFVAFAASVAKPIANIAMKSGDFGVAMGVIEEFDDHDWQAIFGKIAENVNDIADTVSGMLNILPDEMMDSLLAFSVTKGPLIAAGLNVISNGLRNFAKTMDYLHTHPFWQYLSVGAASLGVAALIEKLTQYFAGQAMDEAYDVDMLNSGLDQSQGIASSISKRQSMFAQAVGAIDSQSARMQSSLARIGELNKAAAEGDSEALVSLAANVNRYNALFPDFAIKLDTTTGRLDRNSEAIIRNAEAYAQAYEKSEKTPLLTERLAEIDDDIEAAKAQFKKQQELAAVASSYLDEQTQTALGSVGGMKYLYNDLSYLREQYDDATTQTAELKTKVDELNAERAEVMADLMYAYLGPDAAVKYKAAYGTLSGVTGANLELDLAKTNLDRTLQTVQSYAQKIQPILDAYRYGKSALALTWEDVDELWQMNLGDEFEESLMALLRYKDELPGLNSTYVDLYTKQRQYTDNVEDANAVIEELTASLYEEMAATNSVNEAQDEATAQAEKVAAAAATQKAAVDSLVESYESLKQASYDALHSALSAFEEIKAPDKEYDFASAITSNTTLTESYLAATMGFANELLSLTSGNYDVSKLPEGVTVDDLITFINDIRKTGDMHKLVQAYEQYRNGDLASLAGAYSSSLNSASSAAEINAFMDALQSDDVSTMLGIITGEIPIPDGISAPLLESLNALMQMYEKLVGYGYEPEEGFLKLLNPKEEENAYNLLEDFQKGIEELFGVGEDADEDTANGVIGFLNKAIQTTVEERMPGLVDAIHNAEKPIDGFNKQVETTAENQEDAATNTDKHATAVGALQSAMDAAMSTLQNAIGVYQQIAGAAGSAAEAVSGLVQAMSGVSAIPSVSIPSGLEHNLGAAFGDSIYRASGGPVFGPYIGVDNIPAMLTPGEFVVRRGAAQALGRSFLENINRLNIPGAMDALMKQAIPMPGHFVAYNNSRSYDNHAQVIQNINTNNAAFTYRRASRFVGAL